MTHLLLPLQLDISGVVATEQRVLQLQQEQGSLLKEILPGVCVCVCVETEKSLDFLSAAPLFPHGHKRARLRHATCACFKHVLHVLWA